MEQPFIGLRDASMKGTVSRFVTRSIGTITRVSDYCINGRIWIHSSSSSTQCNKAEPLFRAQLCRRHDEAYVSGTSKVKEEVCILGDGERKKEGGETGSAWSLVPPSMFVHIPIEIVTLLSRDDGKKARKEGKESDIETKQEEEAAAEDESIIHLYSLRRALRVLLSLIYVEQEEGVTRSVSAREQSLWSLTVPSVVYRAQLVAESGISLLDTLYSSGDEDDFMLPAPCCEVCLTTAIREVNAILPTLLRSPTVGVQILHV